MSNAFLDTTILTDALLKPGPRAEASRAAIRRYEKTFLPVYAIKEFKAGPLSYFRWVHNKCVIFRSYARVLNALGSIARTPQRYRTSTAIEALEVFAARLKGVTPQGLAKTYGQDADIDVAYSDMLRLSIRTQVDLAWEERRDLTSETVDELDCYTEAAPYIDERGNMQLQPNSCQPQTECSLARRLKKDPEALKRMRDSIVDSDRAENTKRAHVLRDLYRIPKQPLTREKCRSLGDAIFAFFCPIECVILTTNSRDHKPLAEALGKVVETP
jgi:hypothetical protein